MSETKETKKEEKFYKGYIDAAFKSIFCKEKNRELLKWFIEKALDEEVEIIDIMSSEILKNNIHDKNKTLDVLVKLNGKLLNLEINSGNYDGLHQRNAAYIFAKYSEEVKVKEKYKDMRPVLQINMTKELPKRYPEKSVYELIDIKSGIKFIDNFKIIEYNIDKIFDACYNKGNDEYKFIAMLDADEKQLEEICKGDPMMKKFKESLLKLNKDEEFHEFISAEEDSRKRVNTLVYNAKLEGEKAGENKSKIDIAKKMFSKEMSFQDIVDVTGLTKEQVEDLKNSL